MEVTTDWDGLRYLLAVAETGSMRGAAERLSVNHATVSRRVRALQDRFGARLLERRSEGYVATRAGEELLEVAVAMRDQVEAVARRVSGRDARLKGRVRVTVTEALSEYLVPAFAAFGRRYPEIQLTLIDRDVHVDVAKGEADIAVRLSTSPPEELVGRRVGRLEGLPYASRELVGRLPEAGIFAAPWVDWDEAFAGTAHVRWLRERVPEHQIVARVQSTRMLVQLIRAGAGIGLLGDRLGDPDPELVRVGPVVPGIGLDLWVLTHGDLRSNARVSACTEHLYQALSRLFAPKRRLG